jgi:hypothetical protein
MARVVSSQSRTAPKDNVDQHDGATLDDLSREPEPVPGVSRCGCPELLTRFIASP